VIGYEETSDEQRKSIELINGAYFAHQVVLKREDATTAR
jgi:hypothetical protein